MAYVSGPIPSVKTITSYLRWLDKVGDPKSFGTVVDGRLPHGAICLNHSNVVARGSNE